MKSLIFSLFAYLALLPVEGMTSVEIKATGTNQTTGHIATLLVENRTQEIFTFETRGFFIPSEGKFQSYVVPYPLEFTLASGESAEIPIFGYCADVNTPPAPMGHLLADFSDWIFHSDEWFNEFQLDLTAYYQHHGIHSDELSAFKSNPIVFNSLYFFSLKKDKEVLDAGFEGHAVTNHIPIDRSEFFHEYALVIPSKESLSFGLLALDAAFSLSKTLKQVQEENRLITPYSGTPKREKDALMQHSIWIYTAALEGKVYSRNDFELKLKEELKRQTGMSLEEMPEEIQSSLKKGVEQFWEAFQLLGEKSGVFTAS